MKAIGKGILVVVVTILLFGASMKVKAGTIGDLAKLINEHVNVLIHQGTCKVDAAGKLTSVLEEAKEMAQCEAGIGDDPSIHYVLIYRNSKPDRLIRFDINSKQQEVIWRTGTEV